MRFIHYRDARGLWRWRLIAANNRTIADSGEGYKTESNVLRAIEAIVDMAIEIGDAERPVKGESAGELHETPGYLRMRGLHIGSLGILARRRR